MDEYRALVRRALYERNKLPVLNGTVDHAVILFEEMLLHADQYFALYTTRLNPDIYGSKAVVDAASLFLAHDKANFEIVFDEDISSSAAHDNALIAVLGQKTAATVSAFIAPTARADAIPFHFAILDNWGFRFEPDKNENSAIAVFGDEEKTASLIKFFKGLKEVSVSTDLKSKLATA